MIAHDKTAHDKITVSGDSAAVREAFERAYASRPGSEGVIRIFADLPGETLLTTKALAEGLGVCERTVQRMVDRGELPPGIPFAGFTRWSVRSILDWMHEEHAARIEQASRRRERIRQYESL